MSLVKKLTPKTPKATEFCEKYGTRFTVAYEGEGFVYMVSDKTGEKLLMDSYSMEEFEKIN